MCWQIMQLEIRVSDDMLITGAIVSSGEVNGKRLRDLIRERDDGMFRFLAFVCAACEVS